MSGAVPAPAEVVPAPVDVVTAPAEVVPGSVGILGGTFDPVHVGHLALAEEAREALGLGRVLFVPAALPPHKLTRRVTPAADRVAMVELAIADNPALALSRLELDRRGPSYTVDTLAELAADVTEPVLILSAETLRDLPGWRDPLRIVALARVAVAPREGYPLPGSDWLHERFGPFAERFVFLDGPRLRVSASEIRARVTAGRSVRYLVPSPVADYIADHRLYRGTTEPRTTASPEAGIIGDTMTRTTTS